MKRNLCFLMCTIFCVQMIYGQVGKVGINTDTPAAMLHVKDSSVVFTGLATLPTPAGNPPVNGPGIRMMWYPDKAAFRAGSAIGQQWDKDSTGIYSFAIGHNVRASGFNAVSIGNQTKADGNYSMALGPNNVTSGQQSSALGSFLTTTGMWSTAIGINSISSGSPSLSMGSLSVASGSYSTAIGTEAHASGLYAIAIGKGSTSSASSSFSFGEYCMASGYTSTAIGSNTQAIGSYSTAMGVNTMSIGSRSTTMGSNTMAKGDYATAIGSFTLAKPFAAVALGQYNDTTSISSTSWDLNDPLLIVGNGISNAARSNAITILKNAKTGVNTSSPDAMLHVIKDTPTNGPYNPNAAAIFEGGQGSFIQLSNNNDVQNGILSGNEVTSLRSALIFSADSSVQVRSGGNTTRFSIEKDGKIGIGTVAPQRLLHVSLGNSGALAASSAVAVFEDDANASISLLTPNANESAIYFGNTANATHGGIVYNSTVPNGLAFRTNGNSTKAVINDAGNFGIGEITPDARLHVANGTGGMQYNAETDFILEDNSHTYIQFSSPTGSANGLLSGNAVTTIRSALLFMADSTVQIRSGGNTPNLTIDKSGNTNTAGEIRRSSTGSANIVPICYGSVDANGTILSGTGNFTVAPTPPGYYEITITGETYTNAGYSTSATPNNSNPRFLSTGNSGGKLVVRTFTSAGALIDTPFHFVVYKL